MGKSEYEFSEWWETIKDSEKVRVKVEHQHKTDSVVKGQLPMSDVWGSGNEDRVRHPGLLILSGCEDESQGPLWHLQSRHTHPGAQLCLLRPQQG